MGEQRCIVELWGEDGEWAVASGHHADADFIAALRATWMSEVGETLDLDDDDLLVRQVWWRPIAASKKTGVHEDEPVMMECGPDDERAQPYTYGRVD